MVAMSWPEDRCPTIKHTNQISRECEMNTSNEGTLVLTTVKNTQTYLIVVDGKNGQKAISGLMFSVGPSLTSGI